jgi:hypothetical protein
MGVSRNSARRPAEKISSRFLLSIGLSSALFTGGCIGVLNGSKPTSPANSPVSISNAGTSSVTPTAASVSWQTNVPANSQVEFGTSPNYGSSTTLDTLMVTSHLETLANLQPGTVYHFRVHSTDAKNNAVVSGDMTFTTPSTPDTTPPTVAINSPQSNVTLSANVNVMVTATDNVGVTGVQLKVDNANAGTEATVAPYVIALDTRTLSDGNHVLTAVARDAAGNTATSPSIPVKVNNATPDTTPPTVSVTSPVSGASVSGTITVSANATDNVAVASVQFRLDGNNLGGLDLSAPYSVTLNTTTVSNGSHTVAAIATDSSGNTATSATVTVSVNNAPVDTTPPTVSITSPASGASVSGTITVSANAMDNVAVASVQFQVDGANAGSKVSVAPYTTSLNTAALTNGSHTLTALARDAAGNTGTSAGVIVNVTNTVGPGQLPAGLGWFDLPNTKLQSVCPPVGDNQPSRSATYNFPFYCQYVVRDWSGGIADTKRNRLILWGGGHSAYYGNELYSFDLNTLQLTRLNDPSPIADGTSCPQALSDGKPNARHTYAGLAYITHADKMFVYSGGLANTDGCNSNDTWTLDMATLEWQRVNPVNGVTPFPQGLAGPSVAYDPISKLVYVQDREAFWSYNYDTNTYSQLNHTGSSLHINSVVDPKRQLFLTVGGPNDNNNGPSLLAISIASGSNYALQDWTSSVTGCAALMASASPGLVYDPVLDRIVGWPDFGNTAYLFDPDTKSCTTQTFAGGPPDSAHEAAAPDSTGTYGRFQYFPALGVYALVNDWNIDVHVLRLTNGPANPNPPITVSGVSSNNITTSSAIIDWTTSLPGTSQVEYGTTTNYGQTTALLSTLLTSHQQTLTNLTPNTLYHYRVHSLDVTSLEAVSADFALVTSSGGDVTPPTVSISSPATGATISGNVSVSASASDNVGVSWVQFYLDGGALGGHLTAAPYSTSWNTAAAANGGHSLTAVASDAAGNTTTSSPVAVTVSNTTPSGGSAAADFQARCQAAGVIRCIGFDSTADIVNKVDDSSGYVVNITGNGTTATATIQGGSNGHIVGEDIVIRLCTSLTAFNNTGNNVYKVTAVSGNSFSFAASVVGSENSGNCVVRNVPEIDAAVSASGGGSLKMTVPAFTSANSSGEFHTFFLDDKSAQFGSSGDPKCQPGTLVAPCAGSDFYIQYRFRVNDVMLNTVFSKSNGWKMSIINDPGTNSCTAIHIVTEDSNMSGYPQMYHSCGGKDNKYENLETFVPAASDDYFDQNAALGGPNTACFHYGGRGTPPGVKSCFTYTANEWMTFQYHVKIGTWYVNNSGNYHRDSTVEMWVAHEGKPSELVLSYNDYDLANLSPTDPKYPLMYGQVWLLPYQTNKDATQAHSTGYVWYDELIISKNRIPDPAVSVPNAPDALRATAVSPSQINLTWRDNSGGSASFKIERCSGTDDACWAGYAAFSLVTTVGAGATTYGDTGLTGATPYTYRVRATNSAGDSAAAGGSCWNTVSANGSSCYGTAKTK